MENPLRDMTDSAQLEMERARMVRDPYLHGAEEPVRVRYVGGPLDGRERALPACDLLPTLRVLLCGGAYDPARIGRYRRRERVTIYVYSFEGEE